MLLALKMKKGGHGRTKECGQLLEAGKGKETDSRWSLQEECSPVDTLNLAQQDPCQTSAEL